MVVVPIYELKLNTSRSIRKTIAMIKWINHKMLYENHKSNTDLYVSNNSKTFADDIFYFNE